MSPEKAAAALTLVYQPPEGVLPYKAFRKETGVEIT